MVEWASWQRDQGSDGVSLWTSLPELLMTLRLTSLVTRCLECVLMCALEEGASAFLQAITRSPWLHSACRTCS